MQICYLRRQGLLKDSRHHETTTWHSDERPMAPTLSLPSKALCGNVLIERRPLMLLSNLSRIPQIE